MSPQIACFNKNRRGRRQEESWDSLGDKKGGPQWKITERKRQMTKGDRKQAIWGLRLCFLFWKWTEISKILHVSFRFSQSRQEETLTQTRFDKSSEFCSYVMTCYHSLSGVREVQRNTIHVEFSKPCEAVSW